MIGCYIKIITPESGGIWRFGANGNDHVRKYETFPNVGRFFHVVITQCSSNVMVSG